MNEFISHFHFLRPLWLLLIIPAILVLISAMRHSGQASEWRSIVDSHLLPYLLEGKTTPVSKLPLYGLMALWIVGSVALAGPAWQKLPQPLRQDVSALVVLWDMSPSMNAADIKPSRLVRSRLKLTDLLNQRHEGLTALITYAGEAHIVTPLTDDTRTIISLMPSLSPDIMPLKGSNPEMAMERAIELLNDAGVARGDILFITDGIDPAAVKTITNLQKASPHQITIWGIGTDIGAPIPIAYGGFARDDRGEMVIAKLDESLLRDLSDELGGLYVPFTNDELDIRTITNFSLQPDPEHSRETLRVFDEWYEHGPYLLLFILPLAALAFRRGWLLSLAFIAMLSSTENAVAFGWQDLWQTRDQQAHNQLQAGNPQDAAEKFTDQEWKAIASYKADDYETAAELFQHGNSATAKYNYGNALTHLAKYDEAITAYDKALEQNPDFEDARKNRAIAEQLKQLQQQQEQQQKQQQDQQQDDQEQDGQQQDNQQQNGQQQSNSEQQNQSQNESNDQQNAQDQQNSSEQKNSDQQNQQTSDQAQTDKSSPSKNESEQGLSEEQKQALDNKYQPGQEDEQEKEQQAHELQLQQPQPIEDPSEDQSSETAVVQMGVEENSEEQQALEQWLRKVPDDPSGLLRNKFKHEYNQRRRAYRAGEWRPPENDANKRW